MAKIGADISAMETMQSKFSEQAGSVRTMISTLDNQVQQTWWEGNAANRFRDAWSSQFKPALGKLEEELEKAKSEIGERLRAISEAT